MRTIQDDERTEEIMAVQPLECQTPPPVRAMRILCVDDNWDAADSLGELLAIAGHEVVVRHNGRAALEAVRAGFRPDVCVLDISMPGMDGCELAAALRATRDGKDFLIVAVTALSDYQSLERMSGAGFDLQFTKPVAPHDLCTALNFRATQLGARSASGRI